MKDCKHKIFRRLCTVCWYKYAKGVFRTKDVLNELLINDPDDGSWVGR